MHVLPTFSIIGPGRVGTAIGRLFVTTRAAQLHDVMARQADRALSGVAFIGGGQAVDHVMQLRRADIFMLTVPDEQIESCCRDLVNSGRVEPGTIVLHCSGVLTAQVLHKARAAGGLTASIHPVRTFADPAQVAANFDGTYCGVEGDADALQILVPLFEQLGALIVPLNTGQKTLYHAAAVFASNYLVTLIDSAMQCYVQAGVAPDTALKMLAPLVRESAENAFRLGPAAALTGPVARGDLTTVARHQHALDQWHPMYGALYSQLAAVTTVLSATRSKR